MINKFINLLSQSAIATLIIAVAFVSLEPAISYAISAQSQFTISQTVNTELSFATTASNVTMNGALGGIAGGTATGLTQVAVRTNDLNGYNMTITSSSTTGAMQNTASTTAFIPGYPASTTPDYNFNIPANSAAFGYTVNASSSGDVVQVFRNATSACNQAGGSPDGSHCWFAATSSAYTIISHNIPTPSTGATTTLSFEVGLAANSMVPNGTYIATTTLTATSN